MQTSSTALSLIFLLLAGFCHAANRELPIADQQSAALKILANDAGLNEVLHNVAVEKLRFFSNSDPQGQASLVYLDLPAEQRTQVAIEFSLASFTSPAYDLVFREQLIKFLGNSNGSGKSSLDVLLPIARGLRHNQPKEIKWAADSVLKISKHFGSDPARSNVSKKRPNPVDLHLPDVYSDSVEMLREEPIKGISHLGGGINGTFLVEFENREKAVFKPLEKEYAFSHENFDARWINFIREVKIPIIIEEWLGNREARARGLSSVAVPPTVEVILAHEGEGYGVGSLQLFRKHNWDIEKIALECKPAWKQLIKHSGWRLVAHRIRTLDFLVGNYDRLPLSLNGRIHPKNIMLKVEGLVDEDCAALEHHLSHLDFDKIKFSLIDNGLGMGRQPKFDIRSFGDFPLRKDIPKDLADVILSFDEEAFRKEFSGELPKFGIDDFIDRLHQAQHRLKNGP